MKTISAISIECNSAHTSLLMLINKWTTEKGYNTNIFTSKNDAIVPDQKFAILPIYEAKYSDHVMICWDILSLQLCLDFPRIEKIIYLQNDQIPWMQQNNIEYKLWSNIFDDPRLAVVSTDEEIINIFRLTWNKGIFIESLDSEKFHELL